MTVLLCIPERHIQRLVQVNLERQEYTVLPTVSWAQALDRMSTEPQVGVFVLDADLRDPDIGGMIKAIRSDDKHAQARIIVLGEKADDEGPGGDLFIAKASALTDIFGGGDGPRGSSALL